MTRCKKVTEIGYERVAESKRKHDSVISCDSTR